MTPADLRRVHKELLGFERIEGIRRDARGDRGTVAGVDAQAAAEREAPGRR